MQWSIKIYKTSVPHINYKQNNKKYNIHVMNLDYTNNKFDLYREYL